MREQSPFTARNARNQVPSISVTNRNAVTGYSERCGFVEMRTDFDAQTALNGLNFADFDGRLMSVIRAVTPAAVRT